MARASRRRFSENFFIQKARFLFGTVALTQPTWPCQKHPWTKMAHFFERFAISGEPAKSRFAVLKAWPSERRSFRTVISADVPRCRM